MNILKINQSIKNLKRLREIIGVLITYGFDEIVEQLNLRALAPFATRVRKKRAAAGNEFLTAPQRFRLAFEELGPVFIKLGQILSSRPDLLPKDYIEEFKKLQDDVPPMDMSILALILENELGSSIEEIFSHFEPFPFASASMAQVHKAVLSTGEEVAVKIQRPENQRLIATDISIIRYLAGLVEKYIPESRDFDPIGIVEEFASSLKKEMDFTIEASNIDRMTKNFPKGPVKFTHIYWQYTTRRIMTMELLKGIKIDNLKKLKESGIDKEWLAKIIVENFFAQVLEHGLFHADPHPGNIIVVPETQSVYFLDLGLIGRLNKRMMDALATTFVLLLKGDVEGLAEEYLDIATFPDDLDYEAYYRDLRDFIEPNLGKSIKDIRTGEVFLSLLDIMIKYRVRIPKDMLLLFKAIFMVEGLARTLYPELNFIEVGEPYAKKLFEKRMGPGRMAQNAIDMTKNYIDMISTLPKQIKKFMKKLNTDNFKIDFAHQGLDNLISEMDRSSNRISISLIISALIIGSSLIIHSGKGSLIFGIPVLGFLGFFAAGVMGFFLAIVILRSGKF